jgi:hypothetical protein
MKIFICLVVCVASAYGWLKWDDFETANSGGTGSMMGWEMWKETTDSDGSYGEGGPDGVTSGGSDVNTGASSGQTQTSSTCCCTAISSASAEAFACSSTIATAFATALVNVSVSVTAQASAISSASASLAPTPRPQPLPPLPLPPTLRLTHRLPPLPRLWSRC